MKRLFGESKSDARLVVDSEKRDVPSRVDALLFLTRGALLLCVVVCAILVTVHTNKARDAQNGHCPLGLQLRDEISYGSACYCRAVSIGSAIVAAVTGVLLLICVWNLRKLAFKPVPGKMAIAQLVGTMGSFLFLVIITVLVAVSLRETCMTIPGLDSCASNMAAINAKTCGNCASLNTGSLYDDLALIRNSLCVASGAMLGVVALATVRFYRARRRAISLVAAQAIVAQEDVEKQALKAEEEERVAARAKGEGKGIVHRFLM